MSTAQQWGLPDWGDQSAYPRPDDISALEWWWEFTRRRPDYRQLWSESDKRDWKHDSVLAADVDWLRCRFQISRLMDPTKSYSESTLSWNRYPNKGIFDPQDHHVLPEWSSDGTEDIRWTYELTRHKSKLAEEAHHVRYQFNLDEPLEPQLQRAVADLRREQKALLGNRPTPRNRRENWPLFLRALDAKDAGATYSEMTRIFWPKLDHKKPESARDTLQAARRVRDNLTI